MTRKRLSLFLAVCILTAANAFAEETADQAVKIDPDTYICAELLASSVNGEPPITQSIQLDGYAAGKARRVAADATTLEATLLRVWDSCSPKPAEKVLTHWQEARKFIPALDNGAWSADKTTCADYAANPDDGSGFVFWLDAYNRARTGTTASILDNQKKLDGFLEACQAAPQRLMLDVLAEKAKQE